MSLTTFYPKLRKMERSQKRASGGEVSHLESWFANTPDSRSLSRSHSLTGCARELRLMHTMAFVQPKGRFVDYSYIVKDEWSLNSLKKRWLHQRSAYHSFSL